MISQLRQPDQSGPDGPRRSIFLWIMAIVIGLMGLTLGIGGVWLIMRKRRLAPTFF